jgi:hypothetical protein
MKHKKNMSSSIRSRSVSRSRVVKRSDLFKSGEALDPVELLSDVLSNFKNVDVPLAVKITDGTEEVTYILSSFLSKDYEVVGEIVRFGFKKLNIKNLRAFISFEIQIEEE